MADRFPEEVATVLAEAGWTPAGADRESVAAALTYVEEWTGQYGATFERFSAATDALNDFGGLSVNQDGAGVDFRRRPFLIDPLPVAATTESLADFSVVLGEDLFPIGMEGDHDSILAIAENGAVFALDHAGEWHLGDTIDEALVTLVTGRRPARVDSHGNW